MYVAVYTGEGAGVYTGEKPQVRVVWCWCHEKGEANLVRGRVYAWREEAATVPACCTCTSWHVAVPLSHASCPHTHCPCTAHVQESGRRGR